MTTAFFWIGALVGFALGVFIGAWLEYRSVCAFYAERAPMPAVWRSRRRRWAMWEP